MVTGLLTGIKFYLKCVMNRNHDGLILLAAMTKKKVDGRDFHHLSFPETPMVSSLVSRLKNGLAWDGQS